ncbi:MAG: 3-methyl-2-oxobutanoate hydroxymethyltransferase [Gemmobacter sp.]|uniref:3-methyl-2-oxobutanoate hydroxymethyltransferase n=1 Tax=Gemmobacter sp. TaxID=1898957 RepID=UPI001A5BD041|nr:3-methyl-2-oxobutanoate hydroxymethyltransferase [Gemmobacter sp.]MBL8562370.1 3-methyl-2-oxobutanoate hydroxymethyltransferase [Gemmobacter sp.]
MAAKINVHDLLKAKGKQKWVQLHVDSAAEAAAAEAAGIRIISCEADATLPGVRAAAPLAFITAGMPHGAAATPDDAIRMAFDTLAKGADSVYTSHSPRFVEAMAREGIPVTAHVGLVPNLAAWTGFRAIGRSADEALAVLRKVREIENAGAACVEVEVVPVQLADHITKSTRMITMGMGCGTVCDTQYLFSCDVLGTNRGHYPRHARRYADFARLEDELQARRVAAFEAFAAEVGAGTYPARGHEVWMEAAEAEAFAAAIAKL